MKPSSLIRLALLFGVAFPIASAHAAFDAGSNSFGSASTILIGDENFSTTTNINAFTAEAGEKSHSPFAAQGALAVKSAWWKWVATDDGYCTVDTFRTVSTDNPLRDTVISVYTGNVVNNLQRLGGNDDHSYNKFTPDNALSSYSFYAVKGNTYHIAVDAYSADVVTPTSNQVVLQLRHLPLRKVTRIGVFASGIQAGAMGQVSVSMTATGSLTGKLIYGTKTYSFAGVFGINGYYQVTFAQKGVPGALPISLLIDGTGEGLARITLGDAGIALTNLPEQVVFSLQNVNSTTGIYTAVLDSSQDAAIGGDGFQTFTVKSTGAVTGSFTTPDGSTSTFSAALVKGTGVHKYSFIGYKAFPATKSEIAFVVNLQENGLVDIAAGNGILLRAAPVNGSLFYPQGLASQIMIEGSTYTKPTAGNRALGFLNPDGSGTLTLTNSGGELLGNILEGLTLSTTNKFTFNSLVRKPALTLNTATGLVTGTITEPAGKKRTLKGVLTLDSGIPVVRGYVSGFTRNVAMKVAP